MRLAFICDTPYQVLNASNLFWGEFRDREDVIADLFFVDNFPNAREIFDRLNKKRLFDNVYFIRPEMNRIMQQGLRRKLRVLHSYLDPKQGIRNQYDGELPKDKYDVIFSSVMTCFVSAVIVMNKGADFCLFDDGTGSYSGDIVAAGGGFAYKLVSKLTGSGANAARAKKLYVNNSAMCRSTSADEICQMPPFTEKFLDMAYDVFGVDKQSGKMSGIVLLSQPGTTPALETQMQGMVDHLQPWKDRVTVRLHPRDTAYDRYTGFALDGKGEMWELKISQMDMDRILLISTCSTAQMTPKLLYGKEPWIVCTYRMFAPSSPESLKRTEELVRNLSESYEHKERILLPENEEQFAAIVSQFVDQQL